MGGERGGGRGLCHVPKGFATQDTSQTGTMTFSSRQTSCEQGRPAAVPGACCLAFGCSDRCETCAEVLCLLPLRQGAQPSFHSLPLELLMLDHAFGISQFMPKGTMQLRELGARLSSAEASSEGRPIWQWMRPAQWNLVRGTLFFLTPRLFFVQHVLMLAGPKVGQPNKATRTTLGAKVQSSPLMSCLNPVWLRSPSLRGRARFTRRPLPGDPLRKRQWHFPSFPGHFNDRAMCLGLLDKVQPWPWRGSLANMLGGAWPCARCAGTRADQ